MIFGLIPTIPVFADDEPVLLKNQKLDGMEYDENVSYAMMGTVWEILLQSRLLTSKPSMCPQSTVLTI